MNTPTPLLSDLLAMTAMRIASNGRVITRVTAELELSRVTGEYLAGFAYDLNPIERERVAREIKLDLNNLRQTRSYVVCEATERHPDYLLSSPTRSSPTTTTHEWSSRSPPPFLRPSTTSTRNGCGRRPATESEGPSNRSVGGAFSYAPPTARPSLPGGGWTAPPGRARRSVGWSALAAPQWSHADPPPGPSPAQPASQPV